MCICSRLIYYQISSSFNRSWTLDTHTCPGSELQQRELSVWGRLEIKRKRVMASIGRFWKCYLPPFFGGKKKASLRRCIGIETWFKSLVCVPFDFEKASIEIKKCFLLLINRWKDKTLESCFVHTLDHSITSRKEGGEREIGHW